MNLKRALVCLACAVVATTGLTVPAAAADEVTWLVVSNTDTLPSGFAAQVAKAGGKVGESHPFGVATVKAPASFRGVAGTTATVDTGFTLEQELELQREAVGVPPNSGNDDELFDLQWGHAATRSVQAWEDGARGQGVRIAVLDTAFDLDHPDLEQNINASLSTDFTGLGLSTSDTDPEDHGTQVAGTIAAADNGLGTIGIAPEAELVLLRVIGENEGGDASGEWEDIIAGIRYAAGPKVDADIINMSLGEVMSRGRDTNVLINAINKAVRWAHQQGTTVIVSAGNEGRDFDGNGNVVRLPASSPQAITIAATGPVGWGLDPANADLRVPSLGFTNYGRSFIDFSAPGGNPQLLFDPNYSSRICQVAGKPFLCAALDLVHTTWARDEWGWALPGTSMAAAHASGVAALIISEYGGELKPAHVERELRKRAIDAGQPGRDPWHGLGAVTSGH